MALQLVQLVIRPTLAWLGPPYRSAEAELLLLAIAGQESEWRQRRQLPGGPARSWWQIEPPTALAVFQKWSDGRQKLLELGVQGRSLEFEAPAVLRWSEVAACTIARGILWLDPTPLPAVGDLEAAWHCYARRCWRPGLPRPETWPDRYRLALECCR